MEVNNSKNIKDMFEEYKTAESESVILPEDIVHDYCELFSETFEKDDVYLDYDFFEEPDKLCEKNNIFESIVRPVEKWVVLRCELISPALHDYRLVLFDIKYKRSRIYPCKFDNIFFDSDTNQHTDSVEDLKRRIDELFKSGRFRHSIKMILAQIDRTNNGYEYVEEE